VKVHDINLDYIISSARESDGSGTVVTSREFDVSAGAGDQPSGKSNGTGKCRESDWGRVKSNGTGKCRESHWGRVKSNGTGKCRESDCG
jgi:hypothetical protein